VNKRAISLFSGIGGLDIGFATAGFDIIAQVEKDTFCQRVLTRHKREWWPNAAIFPDVRDFGRKDIAGEINVIFGGFPCQPHSVAGKRLGENDDRNLWPEFRRIIGEFRPRTVLLENVPGILFGTGYAVTIIADLTKMGYDCKWGTIQAADTGSPHKRERWFCMANTQSTGCTCGGLQVRNEAKLASNNSAREILGNTSAGDTNITESRMGGNVNGIPAWLVEPRWPAGQGRFQYDYEPPRTVGKGTVKNRAARIAALGNAVMPQIAYPLACEMMKFCEGQ
jgi:DNA (cytosine-5)-methyltransferase 1